jgi:hypothetical protein
VRPLGRPFRRWDDNIEVDLTEIVWRAWADSGQGKWRALVTAIMNIRFPQHAGKVRGTVSF